MFCIRFVCEAHPRPAKTGTPNHDTSSAGLLHHGDRILAGVHVTIANDGNVKQVHEVADGVVVHGWRVQLVSISGVQAERSGTCVLGGERSIYVRILHHWPTAVS